MAAYIDSKGLRLSIEQDRAIRQLAQREGVRKSVILRRLLALGLASYRIEPEAGDLLEAAYSRLADLTERLEVAAHANLMGEQRKADDTKDAIERGDHFFFQTFEARNPVK
jgi:hypothetical protein